MCSLGHHQDETVRSPRRHLDDTWRKAMRATPAKSLAERKASKTAELRAELETREADALAVAHGVTQFDLLPRGREHLADDTGRAEAEIPFWARMP